MGTTDWVQWHREYDDATSDLSRRRRSVQTALRRWFAETGPGPRQIVSACSGDGRDLLEVLVDQPDPARFRVRLLELDDDLAARAEEFARAASLDGVEVLRADAGLTDSYDGATPADLVMWCGVFGNLTDTDTRATIAATPQLCAPSATVVWTRGRFADRDGDLEPTDRLRGWFADAGFDEVSLDAPADTVYRVGVHRLSGPPGGLTHDARLFTFVR